MRRIFAGAVLLCAIFGACQSFANGLRFDPQAYKIASLTMPNGEVIHYKAYLDIAYVENPVDAVYQKLNLYVPLDLKDRQDKDIPILMRNNVGGYMASPPGEPSPIDATGRALQEGYIVCIPGARGNGAVVRQNGNEIHTGKAPAGLLDLKAATAYLHYNDDLIPGNSQRIFTDGTSAGGAMSALQGITGDSPEYAGELIAMGAAQASNSVYASICYCPITDLNHADMEYEWLYQGTDESVRKLDAAQIAISRELAALCPAYLNSLHLRATDGTAITASNYLDYLKSFLIESSQKALEAGCEIPDDIGIIRFKKPKPTFSQMLGSGPQDGRMANGRDAPPEYSDFVIDIDLPKYLAYVASQKMLKQPPAFDAWGVLDRGPTPENQVFGNKQGQPANFTNFGLRKHTGNPGAELDAAMKSRIALMNPMNFIGNEKRNGAARYWYIRHGAKDRDTSFLVPINLATKLKNAGYSVNFALPWNRPHSGDYNLDDLFSWIKEVK